MGELLHLPTHTNIHLGGEPVTLMRISASAKAYLLFEFTALWIHLPCWVQEKQKKITEASSNSICSGHQKLSREWCSPPKLQSFKATGMQLFYDIPACCQPFQGGWCLKTQQMAYSLWARAHKRICQDSKDCLDSAVGEKSYSGGLQWSSFPEGALTTLQPGNLGRNCATEKVHLSEDCILYRRRKLFSWSLALVGRTSEKRKSECEGQIGLYDFEGQAGQLGRSWATGEGTVGKNRWLNAFIWKTSLQARRVVYVSCA